jgi:outer membrane receptor protein involved in Fe transport
VDREVTSPVRRDEVGQLLGGLWIDAEVPWSARVRTRAGLRADYYRARVRSDLELNSGTEDDLLASPKLSLVLGPWARTEWYLNLGYGYHSNDARGATIRIDPRTGEPAERVDPLVRARGADLGFRTNALRGLQTTVSLFLLDLDSELVFVGDAGGTEASRPSRRRGVEIASFYRPLPWLSLDLDLTFSDAEFTDDAPEGNEIPGAIESTVAAGLAVDHGTGFFGSLRWRYFGPRPLVEDGSVRSGSTSLVNARFGYAFRKGFTLGVEVFNLMDRADSDIEYYYASRLPGEPAEGVEDVHFHPMESRSVRLVALWRFGS